MLLLFSLFLFFSSVQLARLFSLLQSLLSSFRLSLSRVSPSPSRPFSLLPKLALSNLPDNAMRVEVSPRLELSSWQEQEYWRQRYARDDMTTTRAHAAAGRRSTSFHVLPILRAQPDLKVSQHGQERKRERGQKREDERSKRRKRSNKMNITCSRRRAEEGRKSNSETRTGKRGRCVVQPSAPYHDGAKLYTDRRKRRIEKKERGRRASRHLRTRGSGEEQ